MEVVISIIDSILFVLVGISVLYLFIFAVSATKKWKIRNAYPKSERKYKIAVLIPTYKDDVVIGKTIRALLLQEYPKEWYDIVVISDHMDEKTNDALRKLPIKLLVPDFEKSSKAKSLQYAMAALKREEALSKEPYNIVTILDSDNIVAEDYLLDIASAYNQKMKAIQTHRVAKNRNTRTAILDAFSEEVNNSIFRLGHANLGISSALIGSGMAFDYDWFAENVNKISTAGEDKELEVLLLKQNVFIDYLPDTYVYDEKVSASKTFYMQRRRWLAAQFSTLHNSIKELPGAIKAANWDYCDKLFQWMLLPRVLMVGLLVMMSGVLVIFYPLWSVKWFVLLLMLLFAIALATPDYLVDKEFKKAIKHIPFLGFLMMLNLFKLRGVNKNFIHTKKTADENSN